MFCRGCFLFCMENIKPKFDLLVDHIKEYVNNRIEITRLIAIEKGTAGMSNAISWLVLAFLFLFFIVFISFTLAIVLSMLIGNGYSGFLIVSLLYLTAGLILFWKKEKWIIEPISNLFIKNIFKDYNNSNDRQN